MNHCRKGLTTLELLTVIGVILILAGLVHYGLRATGEHAKSHQTEIALENCKSLLKELDVATKLSQDPADWFGKAGSQPDFWRNPRGGNPPQAILIGKALVSEIMDAVRGGSAPGVTANDKGAVQNTRLAIMMTRAIPSNKTALQNIPNDQLFTFPTLSGDPAAAADVPVLLDGWYHVILFVPASGIAIETSAGIQVIRSPDSRPFFASAGSDGRFSGRADDGKSFYGDDNIYSFEK